MGSMGDGASFRMRRREQLAWVLVLVLVALHWRSLRPSTATTTLTPSAPPGCPYVWNGGAPSDAPVGSCWCGQDNYCMCTPSLAIDLVIESTLPNGEPAVVLVERADNGLFATMGGFVDVGETVETAVARELMEETGLELASPPSLLGVWSDPRRDKRRHTVSAVFVAPGKGKIRAGDDARGVKALPLDQLMGLHYAFDHDSIISDYLEWRTKPEHQGPRGGGYRTDGPSSWVRTACT
mmetsp:Transcript_39384/g.106329  ORF Transcript_39384/g.106329 Transcript_39384/m.106329 type:complete len:238 (+) Transcript_39384:26-739(+)